MSFRRFAAALGSMILAATPPALAQDEAGDTFSEAEELGFGQLSVTAELLVEFRGPDLFLGIRDEFGGISLTNDDDSQFGDTFAPGLNSVPVNPGGGVEFDITGFGDESFIGDHFEFGDFEVFVDIYTFIDDSFIFLDGLYFEDTIDNLVAEQSVLVYSESNPAWDGALYDVQVNNAIPNDVDFFRFVGLTPGEAFTAETLAVDGFFVDTALGWFDESGTLIAANDDAGEFGLSRLSGTVPANGEVVLAVTGYQDLDFFEGSHPLYGPYELAITPGEGPIPGDYDGDRNVDIVDYEAWLEAYGDSGLGELADGNGDGTIDAADYTIWRDAFDTQPAAVPEPTSCVGLVVVLSVLIGYHASHTRSE